MNESSRQTPRDPFAKPYLHQRWTPALVRQICTLYRRNGWGVKQLAEQFNTTNRTIKKVLWSGRDSESDT